MYCSSFVYRCTTDRAGPPPCCGPRVWPVGHFPGPCRPFSPVGPAHSPTSISCLNLPVFFNKGQFFHKSQHMKEAAYNFIVSSKTYLNSQVISKRKSTKSQHIGKNERAMLGHGPTGPGHHRAAGRGCGPWPGPATGRAARGPQAPDRAVPRTGSNLTGQMYIYSFVLFKNYYPIMN